MSLANVQMRITLLLVSISIFLVPGFTQTFTVLHTFTGGTDGQSPSTGLILDHNGNLYGTSFGVLYGAIPGNYGTLFKIDRTGKQTILHRFHGPEGANPEVGHLIRDEDGNLYGVTDRGGTFPGGTRGAGGGTVFKFDLQRRTFTSLYTFKGLLDGDSPRGTLVRNEAGSIFGTTFGGGSVGYGTVFKLNKTGKESVLHNFQAGKDAGGVEPDGGLIADRRGNLYGLNLPGGDFTDHGGNIFKIAPSGKETTLYTFTGGADGGLPFGQLLRDEEGNLYGTTWQGGANNLGTIFKLDPTGHETVLHSFAGPLQRDGANPAAGLIRDEDGNLYGTTWAGGVQSNFGTVFKLDSAGQITILYSFAPGAVGSPGSGVVRDKNGNLYGVTVPNPLFPVGFGTVFKLTP
jgi:uncharacterized repeat protein (TIGR03803 family)